MSKAVSSLQKYDRLADRIRLHRQADKRPIVVVEGPSDQRLIQDLEGDSVTTFVAGTRSAVLITAEGTVALGVKRVACLVDRDFDDEVATAEAAGLPVLAWDGADLEDMLLDSPAGARVIEELSSDTKLQLAGGAVAILDRARSQLLPLARLRRANAQHSWYLTFDAVDLTKKIERSSLELQVTSLCSALATRDCGAAATDIHEAARSHPASTCPRSARYLIRGKDICAFLAVALRSVLGDWSRGGVSPEAIAGGLRAAFRSDWMRQTDWYAEYSFLLEA